MVAIIPPQTVLTPADVTNQLQAKGLDPLGLTLPNLSSAWSVGAPGAYNANAMTLVLNSVSAPFRGIRSFEASPTFWSQPDGNPIAGPVAVLRLHPEAARRLEQLVAGRLDGGNLARPVPHAMVIQGITIPANPVVDWYMAGDPVPLTLPGGNATVTFHDNRGLIIDPLAVASMFADLIGAFPALNFGIQPMPALNSAGGLTPIIALSAAATRCHVIDPHGWGYVSTRPLARLKVVDGAGAEIAPVADGGVVNLAAGQRVGRSNSDNGADTTRPLRWGWAVNQTMNTANLVPPAPAGVAHQFLRVMAVDLDWHLLGNRSDSTVAGVLGDDGTVPDFALPVVRPAVPNFTFLVDGVDVLATAGQIAPPAGPNVFALAVSPALDTSVAVPPMTGAAGHWPIFPTPNPGLALAGDVTAGLTAAFRAPGDGPNANLDVVLTVAANAVPNGTFVRAYPRRFQEIAAIAEQPSFVRGNGDAGIAQTGQPTTLLLVNPYNLQPMDPLPNPATIEVDMVVVSRTGQRRIHSLVRLPVSNTTQTFAANLVPFGGSALLATPAMTGLLNSLGMMAIGPSKLFDIPSPPPAAGPAPASIVDLVRRLASEETPRRGPRLPTQARFETILAIGQAPAGQVLAWNAVVSGARWQWESRSSRPDLANPGNPTATDIHASGVRVDGQLAFDLAFHALKRAQPILPLPAVGGGVTPGWMIASAGTNWDDPAADVTGNVSAVMLETVAPFCDTPELGVSAIPIPQPGDTIQGAVNNLASALGVAPPTISVPAEAKLRRRLQREMVTAKYGQRDALWSLRRAISQAREFIYIEGPAFAKTAYPGDTGIPDLVDLIRQRMQNNTRLKVMICLPREPDFSREKPSWARASLAHRKQALQSLIAQDLTRIAAFHPISFPGRPTAIRTTTVIVDDVWCLNGTSHLRRRGMTFDGGVDIAAFDRNLANGYSSSIANFRQQLMAHKLGVAVPTGPNNSSALWTRLATPESAFDVIADLLAEGGLGRLSPIWAGPTDNSVLPQTDDVADPSGLNDGAGMLSLFASMLFED
ncbi:MAG: hypothetical protein OEW58_10325 [Gammaproteobacteria bacterium]|nr:hypothetical protein [Gammaproteobacteria bacterium]